MVEVALRTPEACRFLQTAWVAERQGPASASHMQLQKQPQHAAALEPQCMHFKKTFSLAGSSRQHQRSNMKHCTQTTCRRGLSPTPNWYSLQPPTVCPVGDPCPSRSMAAAQPDAQPSPTIFKFCTAHRCAERSTRPCRHLPVIASSETRKRCTERAPSWPLGPICASPLISSAELRA